MVDTYTKVVLTVIAICLIWICIQSFQATTVRTVAAQELRVRGFAPNPA
jgi:hypothetical protein